MLQKSFETEKERILYHKKVILQKSYHAKKLSCKKVLKLRNREISTIEKFVLQKSYLAKKLSCKKVIMQKSYHAKKF
jgi:hypothetical protein